MATHQITLKKDNAYSLWMILVGAIFLMASIVTITTEERRLENNMQKITMNNQEIQLYSKQDYAITENPFYEFGKSMMLSIGIIGGVIIGYHLSTLMFKKEKVTNKKQGKK